MDLSRKLVSALQLIGVMFVPLALANPTQEKEAQAFVNEIFKTQAPPQSEQEFNNRIHRQLSTFSTAGSGDQISINNLQNIYNENSDRENKDLDSLQQNLNKQRLKDQPKMGQETENMLNQKRSFHLDQNNSESIGTGTDYPIDDFLSGMSKDAPLVNYDANEFGNALTHFSAVTEMNKPMKDNLGGILGGKKNPKIFHGQCQRCKVVLGSSFKDCCHLKGIVEGLLGGCNQEEKQLAVAEVKDKRCHKVSKKYCSHRVLGVCSEKKQAYCCYGSQLAKIIQEIAHKQLDISWGEGKDPNCASLTAKQLSRLNFDTDFARAKLSQLLDDYQDSAQQHVDEVNLKVDQKTGSLQKDLERRFKSQS